MSVNPWEWMSAGAILTTLVGIVTLVVRSGPAWFRMRAQRDNLNADTAAKVQGMTLEYAEQLEAQLKACVAEADKLRASLAAANAENARFRATIDTLPPEYRAKFSVA